MPEESRILYQRNSMMPHGSEGIHNGHGEGQNKGNNPEGEVKYRIDPIVEMGQRP